MSLGLSRYQPEGSICQFLAELEQSLEHHQAQQLSSSAAAQQPQQAQQRPSSMMYRLLQQWSEYSGGGTSLGSSLGLAQQAQQERGSDPAAAAAANRALLSQVEAVLAALPGAAQLAQQQHAQQARQAPSWRQPQLDIPPLDMALAGGPSQGGLGSDPGMPDWKVRRGFCRLGRRGARGVLWLVAKLKSLLGLLTYPSSGLCVPEQLY